MSGIAAWAILGLATTVVAGCEAPAPQACEDRLTDTVAHVVDGDTLDGESYGRIRLALVDTPETGEAGSDEAAAFTQSLCPAGSRMAVDVDDGQPWDTTGTRRVAKVTCSGSNLNAALLEAGHAVILRSFCAVSEFAGEDWARADCR